MATITAAAGGGNWTTGATWVGGVAPTAADDAILNGSSGAVTINSGAVARSLDCTGYTGILTHTGATTLTLGDGTAGAGNVALKLVAGITYTLGNASSSVINFVSTSATTQTITSGGKALGGWTVNGAGSSYQLTDANTVGVTATVTLVTGSLDTNGQTCSWGLLGSSNANVRTLTLGASAITITGTGTSWAFTTATNLTFNANTSTITLSGATVSLQAGGKTFYNLVFTGSGTATLAGIPVITNNLTRTGTAAKTDSLVIGGTGSNISIGGTFTATGNSAANRLLINAFSPGIASAITAATVSITNADFADITGAGAAASFTGTSLGDCGGNTGITFTTPATQTHTASAGGNWSDVTKWTSRVPLPQDDVVIDVNTTGTITADMPRLGKSIDFTGFAGTAAFSSLANSIFGSLTLSSGMTVSGTFVTTFVGRSAYTITSAGGTFTQALTLTAPGGTYTLQDDLITNATLQAAGGTSGPMGTWVTNNKTVTCATLSAGTGSSTAVGTISLGSSIVNLTSTGVVNILLGFNSGTINGGTATFNIVNASANTRTISVGLGSVAGCTFNYTVAGSTGTLVLGAGFTTNYGTLNFSDASNARTLQFFAGSTNTFSAFNVNGTPGKLMSIVSSTPGTAYTLSKPSGTVSSDYLSLQDSTATGGASWYAGLNSTNVSNNTGWFFTAASPSKFMEFI